MFCTSFMEGLSFLFRSKCKLILCFLTMYVYCIYPALSKSTKQLPYCLKGAEISVVLIVFHDVLCEVRAYILPL